MMNSSGATLLPSSVHSTLTELIVEGRGVVGAAAVVGA